MVRGVHPSYPRQRQGIQIVINGDYSTYTVSIYIEEYTYIHTYIHTYIYTYIETFVCTNPHDMNQHEHPHTPQLQRDIIMCFTIHTSSKLLSHTSDTNLLYRNIHLHTNIKIHVITYIHTKFTKTFA